jgi:hypothetical protein
MKNYYFLLIAVLLFTGVQAQIIDFPDPYFKSMLFMPYTAKDLGGQYTTIDANHNGEIEVSEALTISELALYPNGNRASSLVGIANFSNLKVLNCNGNNLSSLDVHTLSQLTELQCSGNNMVALNLTGLVNLKTLICGSNHFASYDCTGLPSLEVLDCSYNYNLASVNISGLSHLINVNCSYNHLTAIDFSGLSALKTLDCSYNSFTALNVSSVLTLENLYCNNCSNLTNLILGALPNLTELNCSASPVGSLNLSPVPNLHVLKCVMSSLTSLNVSPLANLTYLDCNSNGDAFTNLIGVSGLVNLTYLNCCQNNIAALDVSNLVNLVTLNICTIDITSLNVAALSNLREFSFFQTPITTMDLSNVAGNLTKLEYSVVPAYAVDLSTFPHLKNLLIISPTATEATALAGLNYLEDLQWNASALTSLDLSVCHSLKKIKIGGNSHLVYLNLKTGMPIEDGQISYNSSLINICANESDIIKVTSIQNHNNAAIQINSYCNFVPGGAYNAITGIAHFDGNDNGCDSADPFFNNVRIDIADDTTSGATFTGNSGTYTFYVQRPTITLTASVENPSFFNIEPVPAIINFPANDGSVQHQDFCITPNGVHPDLEITILPLGTARPGFDAHYKIIYRNKGNQTQSGNLTLGFNDAVLDFEYSSPTFSSQSNNYRTWNFTGLQPFETREVLMTLNTNSPTEVPPVNSGFLLNFTAAVNATATDETPTDNTFVLNQTVVNSLDPNNKTCLEGNAITPEMAGKYVHYIIRFENSGTANAANVVVKDVIDTSKFDISSLVPLNGSHPFVTRISDTNKIEFIFENIDLPFDDANNDGYVAFKIKTKPDLAIGDTFSNSANIYFDYNLPIITNTATTTIAALAVSDFEFENYFRISPNPANNILNIDFKKQIEVDSISIYNTLGQLVLVIPNAQKTSAVDVSGLKAGNYFIKISCDKGNSNVKFIKM